MVASSNLVRPIEVVVIVQKFDIRKHQLVPVHTKLAEKAKKELFEQLNISNRELPKISKGDPGIAHLDIKEGDVIKIERQNPVLGNSIFYRGVVND